MVHDLPLAERLVPLYNECALNDDAIFGALSVVSRAHMNTFLLRKGVPDGQNEP